MKTHYVSLMEWSILPFHLLIKESTCWWLERRLSGWALEYCFPRVRFRQPCPSAHMCLHLQLQGHLVLLTPKGILTRVHIHMIKNNFFLKLFFRKSRQWLLWTEFFSKQLVGIITKSLASLQTCQNESRPESGSYVISSLIGFYPVLVFLGEVNCFELHTRGLKTNEDELQLGDERPGSEMTWEHREKECLISCPFPTWL